MPSVARRYSAVAIVLHWAIALLIFWNLYLGLTLDDVHGPAKVAQLGLHKSIGITVLALTVLRLIWRLAHRPPPLNPSLKPWERALARTVHWLFYVFMLGMPLTGWAMVSASPKIRINPVTFFNLFQVPAFPWVSTLPREQMHQWHVILGDFHTHYVLWLGYALITLHILGALKHQFLDRDGELGRMIPGLGVGVSRAPAE
jgi:cytochrome b561